VEDCTSLLAESLCAGTSLYITARCTQGGSSRAAVRRLPVRAGRGRRRQGSGRGASNRRQGLGRMGGPGWRRRGGW